MPLAVLRPWKASQFSNHYSNDNRNLQYAAFLYLWLAERVEWLWSEETASTFPCFVPTARRRSVLLPGRNSIVDMQSGELTADIT